MIALATSWVLLASACAHSSVTVTRRSDAASGADEIHLGVGADPSTMIVVQWHTLVGAPDAVRLTGPTGARTVTGPVLSPAPIGTGRFHRVTVDGLRPATTYEYDVATGTNRFAAAGRFSTAPAAPADLRFDAFADQGDCSHFHAACAVIAGIAADRPAFVIAAGDLSYGTENGLAADDIWANNIMSWSKSAPLLPSWGNHETEYPSDPLTNAQARYAAPGNGSYYSVTYAGVHLVTLPERDVPVAPGSPYHEWLATDLGRAETDPAVHWIIAFGHRPVYTTGTKHGPEARLQRDVVTLLQQAHVALVVNGHEHNYERTLPIRDGAAGGQDPAHSRVSDGIVYVVTGGGGAATYNDFGPAQPWDVVRKVTHEHLRMTVHGDQLTVTAVDDSDRVIDEFTITR